jgi:hypothetical protein
MWGKTKVTRISREASPLQITADEKQLENVEYFNYVCSMINYARCTLEIKTRFSMAKAAFNRKKTVFACRLDLNLRKKQLYYIWKTLYGAGGGRKSVALIM